MLHSVSFALPLTDLECINRGHQMQAELGTALEHQRVASYHDREQWIVVFASQ